MHLCAVVEIGFELPSYEVSGDTTAAHVCLVLLKADAPTRRAINFRVQCSDYTCKLKPLFVVAVAVVVVVVVVVAAAAAAIAVTFFS